MLQRFPFSPPGNHAAKGDEFSILQRFVKVQIKTDPVKRKRFAKQPFGLKAGIFDPFPGKVLFSPGENL